MALLTGLLVAPVSLAAAEDVAQVKRLSGQVRVERERRTLPAVVGMKLQPGDVVVTGRDGAVGITFHDDSLLSAGPDSALAIDRFAFDTTTHDGRFETTLQRGTLAVVSGKIAKHAPDAMRVRTPSTVLGVRGTEFLVRVGAPAQ
ncbi:MAG TPA: FecR domain-containing protein [Methylomirabilota bacterium]|nr:FecR domain-containing protein [Methylomirabilota bacterium]